MNLLNLPLPADKQGHMLSGALLAFPFALFSPVLALALVIAAGAWKEWVYDKARPLEHTVDVWDFIATVAGGLLICLMAWRWM